jgi:hypothetical protein
MEEIEFECSEQLLKLAQVKIANYKVMKHGLVLIINSTANFNAADNSAINPL